MSATSVGVLSEIWRVIISRQEGIGAETSVPISDEYLAYVLEQMSCMGRLTWRRMFGGVGIYSGELFFALVFGDQLYFKVDDSNRADFEQRGMERFRPYLHKPKLSMTYYAVPVDVLEDGEQLKEWSKRAVHAARNSARAKAAPRSRNKKRKAIATARRAHRKESD